MLNVRQQIGGKPKTYTYTTIGGKDYTTYMRDRHEEERKLNRERRRKAGKCEYLHANEVPTNICDTIVTMRNSGTPLTQIARNLNLTDSLTRAIYHKHSGKKTIYRKQLAKSTTAAPSSQTNEN